MANMVDESFLTRSIEQAVERVLRRKIRWAYAFKTTFRKNKQIVKGSNRNTFDTGAFAKQIKVTFPGGDKINIYFEREKARYILHQHAELTDYLVDEIVAEIGGEIALMVFGRKFRSRSKKTKRS
jgi:hypothetical protein